MGNGATSMPHLLTSGHRLTNLNLRLLQQSDLECLDDLDTDLQAESWLCWGKIAVRINAQMSHYRETILRILESKNNPIHVSPKKTQIIKKQTRKATKNHQNQVINS